MSDGAHLNPMRKLTLVAMMAAVFLAIVPGRAQAAATPAAAVPSDSVENQPLHLGTGNGAVATGDATAPGSPVQPIAMPSGTTRVLVALGLVLMLILAMRWVGQRAFSPAGGRGARSSVRVISRTTLSPKQQVLLLQVGKRVLVVGDSGGRMTALSEIADPDEVAGLVGAAEASGCETAKAMFGSVFRRAKEPFTEDEAAENEEAGAPWRPSVETPEPDDEARVDGLLDKVRLMRNQFKGA